MRLWLLCETQGAASDSPASCLEPGCPWVNLRDLPALVLMLLETIPAKMRGDHRLEERKRSEQASSTRLKKV